jgi:hypothetical protein
VNCNNGIAMAGRAMRSQPWRPDPRLLGSLPHRDSLELDATETAPRAARRRVARRVTEWSLPEFEAPASLISSELVTNAVVATRGLRRASAMPPVRLWLRGGPGVLAILAWDASLAAPVPREAAADDESGRGLAIVAALSADCGFCYPRHPHGGKVTWAIVAPPA